MENKYFKMAVLGTQAGTVVAFGSLLYKLYKDQKQFKLNYDILNQIETVKVNRDINRFCLNKIEKNNVKDIIIKLYEILFQDKNVNLDNFTRNLNTLKVKKIDTLENINKYSVDALYDIFDNIIYCNNDADSNILVHELLHMASTSYVDSDKNVKFCGFSQEKFGKQIGIGITEGYTELLSKRYSVKEEKKKTTDVYVIETNIARHLERIIGKDKMTSMYFNVDLKGLINQMKKYNSMENIIKFIRCLDEMANELVNSNKTVSSRRYQKNMKYCISFLLNSYLNCLKVQVQTNKIDCNGFAIRLNGFIDSLKNIEYLENGKKENLEIISDRELLKMLDKEEYNLYRAAVKHIKKR